MSNLTIASSDPKKYVAKAFVNSVFPTPVGPEKMKLAIGLLGLFSPTRALLIARDTATTASSCPIIRLCKVSSFEEAFLTRFSLIYLLEYLSKLQQFVLYPLR